MGKEACTRQCISCGERMDKKNLIRIVKETGSGSFCIDRFKKMNGRGAYVCNNEGCLKKMAKARRLDRSFKMHIPIEVYNNLIVEAEKIEK